MLGIAAGASNGGRRPCGHGSPEGILQNCSGGLAGLFHLELAAPAFDFEFVEILLSTRRRSALRCAFSIAYNERTV